MKVAKWGNSLAIRLPASVVEALDLKEGDDLKVVVNEPGELKVERSARRAELIERLKKFRGRLPDDFVFDRDEANAR